MRFKRFRVAQKVFLIREDGKLLILRWSSTGRIPRPLWKQWDFPGGGLDFEEELKEGLAREIKEEIGDVVVEIGKPLIVWDWLQTVDPNVRTVCVGYEGKYRSGEIVLNEEHDAFEWVEVKDLLNYDWSENFLNKAAAKLMEEYE